MLVERGCAEARSKVDLFVGAPRLWVTVHRSAIFIAAQKIGAVRHAMDGIMLAQRAINGKRIVQECGIESLDIETKGDLTHNRIFASGRSRILRKHGAEWSRC